MARSASSKSKAHPHGHAMKIKCIVKRAGVCEKYDERKVYGSIYGACYVVERSEKDCEKIANIVSKKVTKNVRNKIEVDSQKIKSIVIKELKKKDKNAAFMYETHRDIS